MAGRISLGEPHAPRRDPVDFHWLIPMDRQNHRDLLDHGVPGEKLRLMLDYHPELKSGEVPDPYYGGPDGFDKVYEMLRVASEHMLDELFNRGVASHFSALSTAVDDGLVDF